MSLIFRGIVFFVLLTTLFAGCARHITKSNSSDGDITATIKLHGEFCGPMHPNVDTGSKRDNLKILISIKPRDNLDEACQRHDICYEIFGFGDRECDKSIVSDVEFINFTNTSSDSLCHMVQSTILSLKPILFGQHIPILTDGTSYIFTGTFGLLSGLGNVISELSKFDAALNTKNPNEAKAILNSVNYCFDQNTNSSLALTIYNMYFLDTLTEKLLTKEYISQIEASKIRENFLPISKTDYATRWKNPNKGLGPGFIPHPVLFKPWSL